MASEQLWEDGLWIGKVEHEWPLYAFDRESDAVNWLAMPTRSRRTKRLWEVQVGGVSELELTPEVQRRLVPKDESGPVRGGES